jgi:hypothetical protein
MNRHTRRANRSRGIDVGDTEVKYDGRTLDFKVVVNTDEPIEEVLMRIKEAAQGPRQRMAAVFAGELEPDQANKFWEVMIPIVKQEAEKGGES